MEICVALCTYRRKSIADTLKSIAAQKLPSGLLMKVVVADNDVTASAQQFIEESGDHYQLNLQYVHAPCKNISIARNACLANANGQWLAFIDDDEIASEYWLSELYKTAIEKSADVVFGPVKAIYKTSAPKWIQECDFHSTIPVITNGVIKSGYTGNALINLRSSRLLKQKFDLNLGLSGGEDSIYFGRAFLNGAKMSFADAAVVFEDVPDGRASLAWLMQRKFRSGQSSGAVLLMEKQGVMPLIVNTAISMLKLFFCISMSIIYIFQKTKKYKWFLRGVFHFGVGAKLCGKKEIEMY